MNLEFLFSDIDTILVLTFFKLLKESCFRPFEYSLNKHLLSTNYVPATVQVTRDVMMNKIRSLASNYSQANEIVSDCTNCILCSTHHVILGVPSKLRKFPVNCL